MVRLWKVHGRQLLRTSRLLVQETLNREGICVSFDAPVEQWSLHSFTLTVLTLHLLNWQRWRLALQMLEDLLILPVNSLCLQLLPHKVQWFVVRIASRDRAATSLLHSRRLVEIRNCLVSSVIQLTWSYRCERVWHLLRFPRLPRRHIVYGVHKWALSLTEVGGRLFGLLEVFGARSERPIGTHLYAVTECVTLLLPIVCL